MNARKIDIRLPGKGDSTSHGAKTVHQKHRWIRTSRLSIKNSLSARNDRSDSEAGSYFRLMFVFHSILGLRVIKKKRMSCEERWDDVSEALNP